MRELGIRAGLDAKPIEETNVGNELRNDVSLDAYVVVLAAGARALARQSFGRIDGVLMLLRMRALLGEVVPGVL